VGRSGNRRGHLDTAAVLADLDPELHRLPLGIPTGVLGEGEEHWGPSRVVGISGLYVL
jgi:hypothetical protein